MDANIHARLTKTQTLIPNVNIVVPSSVHLHRVFCRKSSNKNVCNLFRQRLFPDLISNHRQQFLMIY